MFFKLESATAASAFTVRELNKRTLIAIGVMLLAAFAVLVPEVAMAEPWDSAAQKVLDIFTGGFARLLAIIAVVALGLAALAGKLSWDWAIKIIIGIVLIFGAATFVDWIIAGVGN